VFVVGLWALLLFGQEIGDIGQVIPLEYVAFGQSPARWLGSLVIPWVVLALPLAGLCVRVMSSSAAEALQSDHIRAAQARGVGARRMVWGHVLPVAVTPTLAVASASANILLINMVVVEQVFDIPGFLREVIGSVRDADVPLLLALSIVSAAIVALVSVTLGAVVDRLDPRARAAR
jgi:peptide/nickel transport system permease protein